MLAWHAATEQDKGSPDLNRLVSPRSHVYASPGAGDFLQFCIIDIQILSGEGSSAVHVSVTRFRLILCGGLGFCSTLVLTTAFKASGDSVHPL